MDHAAFEPYLVVAVDADVEAPLEYWSNAGCSALRKHDRDFRPAWNTGQRDIRAFLHPREFLRETQAPSNFGQAVFNPLRLPSGKEAFNRHGIEFLDCNAQALETILFRFHVGTQARAYGGHPLCEFLAHVTGEVLEGLLSRQPDRERPSNVLGIHVFADTHRSGTRKLVELDVVDGIFLKVGIGIETEGDPAGAVTVLFQRQRHAAHMRVGRK